MDKTEKSIRDSHRLYVKNCREQKKVPQPIKIYCKIANAYNKFLIDKVFAGEEVTLPARMGTLMIVGRKINIQFYENGNPNLSINWRKTFELWNTNDEARARKQEVYDTNEHSGGVRYKFLWSKFRVAIENKSIYNLRMTRTNKRRLWQAIMNGTEYYVKQ